MPWDWNDYSPDPGSESKNLLLSERSQSLALAALSTMDSRANWMSVDDTTWNDIEKALSEAYDELMKVVTVAQGTLYGQRSTRSTNQNVGSPVSTWNNIVFDGFTYTADFAPPAPPFSQVTIPANGLYLLGLNVTWQANSNTDAFLRSSRIILNDLTVICRTESIIVSQQIGQAASMIIALAAGDFIRLQCFTTVPNLQILALPDYSPVLWIERLR